MSTTTIYLVIQVRKHLQLLVEGKARSALQKCRTIFGHIASDSYNSLFICIQWSLPILDGYIARSPTPSRPRDALETGT